MKKFTLAAIALSAAATSLVTTPPATAGDPVTGPRGRLCSFATASDPNPEADENDMAGQINAGPATTTAAGTMICTIQINSGTHNGPDVTSRDFPSDANGVIAGAQAVTYSTQDDAQTFLCTSFQKADGTMIYFTSGDNARWHADPTKPCSEAIQGGTDDVWDVIDGALCPELAKQHPGTPPPTAPNSSYVDLEGDVFVDSNENGIQEGTAGSEAMADLFWDCPVYTFTINDDSNPDREHVYNGPPPLPVATSQSTPAVIDY